MCMSVEVWFGGDNVVSDWASSSTNVIIVVYGFAVAISVALLVDFLFDFLNLQFIYSQNQTRDLILSFVYAT